MKSLECTTNGGRKYVKFTQLGSVITRARKAAEERLPYVHDTWKNRDDEDRIRDLSIGFAAHFVLERALDLAGVAHVSYEATRIDNHRNDDPFDFLLLPPGYRGERELIKWLQSDVYPLVNSQGRMKKASLDPFLAQLKKKGVRRGDLKSSVDNKAHGIESIVHEQHHIAYADQKSTAGYGQVTGQQYIDGLGLTVDEYLAGKQKIMDVHFRVFFEDATLSTAYYVGFTLGRELVTDGTVGPFPGPTPWVSYHKQVIADCYQPGEEQSVIFRR